MWVEDSTGATDSAAVTVSVVPDLVRNPEDKALFEASYAPLAAGRPYFLNLKVERINTVIWATGYRRAYPWLRVPVFKGDGEIAHNGGSTAQSGHFGPR